MEEKDDKNLDKYGEFVCSYYEWLPLEEQKKQAKHLENITQENGNVSKEKSKQNDKSKKTKSNK